MALRHVYEKQEDIPEQYAELFAEKNGQWELTGITGMKTQADVARVQEGLKKERRAHGATKEALESYTELGELEDLQKTLDRIPTLEAASKGKLDDNAIQEAVDRRLEGEMRTRIAPVERELAAVKKKNGELESENQELNKDKIQRKLWDVLDPHLADAKVRLEHIEDARMYADKHFELTDDGKFVTRDQVGVTPGVDAKIWLEEMVAKKPGWVPPSQGGGAAGSGNTGLGGENPWSPKTWDMTAQGKYLLAHGPEKAARMAAAAGTTVGGTPAAA